MSTSPNGLFRGYEDDEADDIQSLPVSIPLELVVRDHEVIRELLQHSEGRDRDDFALSALRLGVLSIRQASGEIDSSAVRREGERLIEGVEQSLSQHKALLESKLQDTLRTYFNPEDGHFTERVQKLVDKDGEFAGVIERMVTGEGSELARRLDQQFGPNSSLARMLSSDPEAGDGFLSALRRTIEGDVTRQREMLLKEFQIENDQSALYRLLTHVANKNKELREGLASEVTKLTDEFDFGRDESAISRMKRSLEQTQSKIDQNLTLDQEDSALSRLKREMFELLKEQGKSASEFQEEIKSTIRELKAREKERAASTRHGDDFEADVLAAFQTAAEPSGAIVTPCGNTTGSIPYCKKGDIVIELGSDHAAAGSRIAIEAKEDRSYSLSAALAEIEEARKNRGAEVGIFIFSSKVASEDFEPFSRIGDDLLVVWDSEDPDDQLKVRLAFSVATALCTHKGAQRDRVEVDFTEIETSIRAVEKQAGSLDEIRKFAEGIEDRAGKIIAKLDTRQKTLRRQVDRLDDQVEELKNVFKTVAEDA
ncbi:hypothetical protein [Stratiformator vulcanicus]|uniref:Uncharacterized protein n=1 Tax=Stratiformator vulcanicus TaxID=2527980 RepID=A0A517R485_9PLAN|nr:hypothetical protein [Stratiformator vulcanicus]QDT38699.1 hypothetical protein Pan189_30950 [Stratiformator vulcanicus]